MGMRDGHDVSDYERVRLENIRRNQEFLASLGLDALRPNVHVGSSSSKDSNKRRKIAVEQAPALPSRRSARVANGGSVKSYADDDEDVSILVGESDTEKENGFDDDSIIEYDDSSVYKYIMNASTAVNNAAGCNENDGGCSFKVPNGTRIKGLSLFHQETMQCPNLPAIYSMQFHPQHAGSILLAAGKGGYISLFRVSRPPPERNADDSGGNHTDNVSDGSPSPWGRPIMSFRAHNRWVSTAKFVDLPGNSPATAPAADLQVSSGTMESSLWPLPPRSTSGNMFVISASDDATVKLWDLSRVGRLKGEAMPQLVTQCKDAHTKGIFCLDEVGGQVLVHY
jgi:WD40 repeat protein